MSDQQQFLSGHHSQFGAFRLEWGCIRIYEGIPCTGNTVVGRPYTAAPRAYQLKMGARPACQFSAPEASSKNRCRPAKSTNDFGIRLFHKTSVESLKITTLQEKSAIYYHGDFQGSSPDRRARAVTSFWIEGVPSSSTLSRPSLRSLSIG